MELKGLRRNLKDHEEPRRKNIILLNVRRNQNTKGERSMRRNN